MSYRDNDNDNSNVSSLTPILPTTQHLRKLD